VETVVQGWRSGGGWSMQIEGGGLLNYSSALKNGRETLKHSDNAEDFKKRP
jgi:hypothetical protein